MSSLVFILAIAVFAVVAAVLIACFVVALSEVPRDGEDVGGMLDGRATDCKSAGVSQAGSTPAPPTTKREFHDDGLRAFPPEDE